MAGTSIATGGRRPGRRRLWALLAVYGTCCAATMAFIGAYTLVWGFQPLPRHIGGPFHLIDGGGRPVTDRSWPGRYQLIYFGYTFCPDACPLALSRIAEALDDMGPRSQTIQPLFITIDPARDSAARLKTYTALFSSRIIGLTGTAKELAHVADEYDVTVVKHRERDGETLFDHSHTIYMMAPNGRFIGALSPDEAAVPMAHDLADAIRADQRAAQGA